MSRDWMADWFDNPIFFKHFRSRLRRQPLISSLVITLVLCLCVVWGGFQLDAFKSGGAFGALLAIQVVILGDHGRLSGWHFRERRESVGNPRFSPGLAPVAHRDVPGVLLRCTGPRVSPVRLHLAVLVSFAWRWERPTFVVSSRS